jgi:predicted aspartyl protease
MAAAKSRAVRLHHCILILAASLVTASQLAAATTIPFQFDHGMIRLKVEVAGKAEPLSFLLDSGAGASVLDLAAARRLGLKLGSRETVQGVQGRCPAYRIDGLAATVAGTAIPRSVLAVDLSLVSRGCGGRIDGLLGADFFRGRIVQIDFAAQKIQVLGRGEAPPEGGQILPLARRNDALCVRVGVDGNAPEWMRLDTGCSSALEWVVSGEKARRLRGTSIATARGSSRSIHTDVAIGAERFTAVQTGVHDQPMFAGEAGLLGNGLLSHFRVTVDADKSRVALSRIK